MKLESATVLQQELESILNSQFHEKGAINALIIGLAPTSRVNDYDIAVRARSEADLPPGVLDTIRRESRGEVNLRYTGEIARDLVNPIRGTSRVAIGASISHYRGSAGTLGFFARRIADGVDGIVSANHVIAAGDEGKEGDAILNPGRADGGDPARNVIAHLASGYPQLHRRSNLDCAFAPLIEEIPFDPAELTSEWRLSAGTAAEEECDVAKVGRTTGLTHGRISAFNLHLIRIRYGAEKLGFTKQIEIDSIDSNSFSRPGDSGALLFSRISFRPNGLIFGCSSAGGRFGSGLTYAHPIDSVLTALDVTVLT